MTLGLGQFLSNPGNMLIRPEIKEKKEKLPVDTFTNYWDRVDGVCGNRVNSAFSAMTAWSPSLYFSSTVSIRAGDKLLEATSETLATPMYFRGATMIQHQLRPRRRKMWRRRRRKRRRRKRRIGYSDSARNLLVKTETSIPCLDRIKCTRLLRRILDEVFHFVLRYVRFLVQSTSCYLIGRSYQPEVSREGAGYRR